MPKASIHSWAEAEEKQFYDMNLSVEKFLNSEENGSRTNLYNAAGMHIGLNSSIRHLVLGKTTQSSAGASIPHVHKQIWGMSPGGINLGDHLAYICHEYSKIGVDYLASYLHALKASHYIIWEDDYCALYIPFGQMSVHELQAMVKRRNTGNYLHLTDQEIHSLSKCEFIAAKIFEKLGINSFNELMISMPFSYENKEDGFRLILTFITREVDLAVSELSLLYVVDKFPHNTFEEIKKIWIDIKNICNLNYDI
jgi:galactose-1-phosphate uridylyltransferase